MAIPPTTRLGLLHLLRQSLAQCFDESEARAHVRLLAEHLLGCPYHQVILEPEATVTPKVVTQAQRLLTRLAAQEPIQYVLGEAYFYGRPFEVTPATLIPRRETEELAHLVLAQMPPHALGLDLGTGSGCLAITLALEAPQSRMEGVDISLEALTVAQRNAHALGAHVQFRQANMLEADQFAPLAYDVMVSNPPYIPSAERPTLSPRVAAHEPATALFVPDDNPLLFYQALLNIALHSLRPGGLLACECHCDHAQSVARLFSRGGLTEIAVTPDAQGLDRFVSAHR